MTVQELMDHLRELPPEHMVLVEGYETGWDSLLSVEIRHLKAQEPCQEWDGEFERHDAGSTTVRGVLLVGNRGHRRNTK